jgi:DUF4097 and DUF4098 domain-containing protein YvlB
MGGSEGVFAARKHFLAQFSGPKWGPRRWRAIPRMEPFIFRCNFPRRWCVIRKSDEKTMTTQTRVLTYAVGFLAASVLAVCAEEDITTKSFTVKPGGKLLMKVDRGSIHVTTSSNDKVDVRVVRQLKKVSAAQAREVFQQHKIDITGTDNEVNITAGNPRKGVRFKDPFNHLQVDYTIAVPRRFDVDLKTSGGNIQLADLEGEAAVRTSGGNIELSSIQGPVSADTSGGNVALRKGQGNASLHTSGGDVRASEVEGNLVAETSGGSVIVEKVKGSVKATTSGGDVRVNEASGPVTAHTSGGNVSAKLSEQPAGASSLKTSGGNVEVKLGENLALDLNAHTSGGSIHSDFPGTLNKQKTSLSGQINGGGPKLVLETSGGNVEIRKQ